MIIENKVLNASLLNLCVYTPHLHLIISNYYTFCPVSLPLPEPRSAGGFFLLTGFFPPHRCQVLAHTWLSDYWNILSVIVGSLPWGNCYSLVLFKWNGIELNSKLALTSCISMLLYCSVMLKYLGFGDLTVLIFLYLQLPVCAYIFQSPCKCDRFEFNYDTYNPIILLVTASLYMDATTVCIYCPPKMLNSTD